MGRTSRVSLVKRRKKYILGSGNSRCKCFVGKNMVVERIERGYGGFRGFGG